MTKMKEYEIELRKTARECLKLQEQTGKYTTCTMYMLDSITSKIEVRFINSLTKSISRDLIQMKKLTLCTESHSLYTKMLEIMADRLKIVKS